MPDGNAFVPRHDAEAERCCLSAALNSHDAALELLELLEDGEYFSHANQVIHRAIREVATRGDQVALVSVHGYLYATNRLGEIGGVTYLAQLEGMPSVVRIEQHARTVRGWARVRRANDTFRALTAEAQSGEIEDVDAWLDTCERRAYDATASTEKSRSHADCYADSWDVLKANWKQAAERADRTWGLATGYQRLDEHTLGMRDGQLWFVGGRPGQGKTGFVQQIAEHVAERGNGEDAVVFCSMEMTKEELIMRAYARHSGQSSKLIAQRSREVDWSRVTEAASRFKQWPIVIDDQKNLSPFQVRAKVRRHAASLRQRFPKSRLRLVVVDYVQLMRPDHERRNGTRTEEIGQITKALKAMAGEFVCPVVALSQLTRHTDKSKPPPPPTLFDFRDSGSIEADGDVLLALHRMDQYRKPGEQRDGICEVHVLKGRSSGENAFEMLFDGATTRFSNVVPEQDRLWRQE